MNVRPLALASLLLGCGARSVPPPAPAASNADADAEIGPWLRQFGSADGEYVRGVGVGAGRVAVVGATQGDLPPFHSAGSSDVFVRVLDAAGDELWTRQLGSPGIDSAQDVAVSRDRVLVVGTVSASLDGGPGAGAFVRAYDALGTEVWTDLIGVTTEDRADAVGIGVEGDVYVGGRVSVALSGQTLHGPHDAFLRRYDAAGTEVWTRQFGSAGPDYLDDLAIEPSGAVWALGRAGGVIAGAAGTGRLFVARWAADGALERLVQLEAAGDVPVAIATDGTGGVYVLADSEASGGGHRVHLCRLGPDGAETWSQVVMGWQFPSGLAAGPDGPLVAGTLLGPGRNAEDDVVVLALDPAGVERWTRTLGGSSADFARGVALDEHGGTFVVGETWGTMPGGVSSGQGDAFVLRL